MNKNITTIEIGEESEELEIKLTQMEKVALGIKKSRMEKSIDKMKNSGVSWIGEIPEEWSVTRLKNLFSIKKVIAGELGHDVLSVTQTGLKIKDLSKNDGQLSMDYSKYQLVEPTDFVMNHMDLLTGWVDCSVYHGVTSPDYRVFTTKEENSCDRQFFKYIFQLCYTQKIFYGLGQGVSSFGRWRLPSEEFLTFMLPIPKIEEQLKLSGYLDNKISLIEATISDKEEMLTLLAELRQAIISEAVTKGLDTNAPMKDSGVDWIGEIPVGWEVGKPFWYCDVTRGNTAFKKDDLKSTGDYVAVQYGKAYKLEIIDEKYSFFVDKSFYTDNQLAKKGDTIYITTSETIEDLGHSCFYARDDVALLGGEQMSLRPHTKYWNQKFFYYATSYFHKEMNQYATGLKVFRVKVDDLKKISVIIPPIHEQETIALYIEEKTSKIDQITADTKEQIALLKEYRQSLISEVVTGKIEV